MPVELLELPTSSKQRPGPPLEAHKWAAPTPARRPCSSTTHGITLSTLAREFPAGGEATPSTRIKSLQVFFFFFPLQGDFHLLDIKVDVNCVICMKLNMTYVNVEWPILSDLVFVTGCDVMCFPFPLKTEIKFLWGSFGHLQILLISFLRSFPYPFTWAEVTYLYGHSPRYEIMWKLKSHTGRTEALLR